ncbi:putative kinesin [Trichoderma velutinum]
MMRSFPNIRFGLMVGIGGGAPSKPCDDSRDDIRLGDVVVSCPTVDSSGVLQYDFGKTMREGKFVQTGTLNKTHVELRTGISVLRAHHRRGKSQIPFHIDSMLQSNRQMRGYFDHPGLEHDQLFRADYDHIDGESSCETCDRGALLVRKPRADKNPAIHYGLIGSANQVMRHGMTREKLRQEKGILCFEMEAAGLMDSLPCLVIRGICDYADSHKNKKWQPYAAATAAAYAKEFLSIIPAAEVSSSTTNAETINDAFQAFISESNFEQLLQLLPVLDQSHRKSAIPNLDPRDPKFSWVFRNMDYESWRSNNSRLVLCLSSPLAHHLSQVSSYIVDQEEKANRPVLYCFCSQVTNGEFNKGGQDVEDQTIALPNILIYTLLHQIIHLSPIEKRILIVRNLLNDLLQKLLEKKTVQDLTQNDIDGNNLPNAFRSFLGNISTDDLLAVFQLTLDFTNPQPTLIVLDGIEKAYQGGRFIQLIGILINDLRRRNSSMKVLLVGPTICDITSLSQESVFIEYDKERKECLSSLQFENTRYENISPEYGGSFEWIWTHNEYKSWSVSETSRLLYVQGKPGSGKSTLTKYFGSNLRTREPNAKQAIVAKFFYSFREGEPQRSHYNMLLSLLYDIVYQDETFFYHQCQTEYRILRRHGSHVKWDYESLKRVLKSLQDYPSAKRFYLIIDAVDESEEADRRDVLNLLYDLCSKMRNCVVKIFISSRPVPQIEARRGQFLDFIRLQDETSTDVFNFAHSLLDGIHLDSTQILPQAVEYIVSNAQGVFLWVKLVGAELIKAHEDGLSQEDILALLKELPTELKDVYERMLDKMKGNSSCLSHGLRMFRFVLLAKRPLTVDELLHSLGIPDNLEADWTFDLSDEALQKRIPSSERIILSCGGNFLEIKLHQEQKIVQVIHQTAHEFLLDPHGAVAESEFRIDKGHSHVCIAIICVRYIMLCAANKFPGLLGPKHWTPDNYEYYAKYLDGRPLASYASCYLKEHIDDCWEYIERNSCFQHLAAQLTSGWVDNPFHFLLEGWSGSSLESADSEKIGKGLLMAAAVSGFTIAAETLTSIGVDIDVRGKSGRTPLSWAAGNGHESIVQLLIWKYADIDLQDHAGRTPLLWAAEAGQEHAVQLLLVANPNLELQDHSGRTALSWAAANGHESITEMLLVMDAKIDSWDSDGRTALSWAAGNGCEATVKLLLEYSAFETIEDNAGYLPISWAARNGHKGTVEIFLQNLPEIGAREEWEVMMPPMATTNGNAAIELLSHYCTIV